MVNSVENSLAINNSLHVGVLNPPQELHKPQLYSDREAEYQFRQISHDLYQKEQVETFDSKRKTPLIVKIGISLAALGAGVITFKKAMKW